MITHISDRSPWISPSLPCGCKLFLNPSACLGERNASTRLTSDSTDGCQSLLIQDSAHVTLNRLKSKNINNQIWVLSVQDSLCSLNSVTVSSQTLIFWLKPNIDCFLLSSISLEDLLPHPVSGVCVCLEGSK